MRQECAATQPRASVDAPSQVIVETSVRVFSRPRRAARRHSVPVASGTSTPKEALRQHHNSSCTHPSYGPPPLIDRREARVPFPAARRMRRPRPEWSTYPGLRCGACRGGSGRRGTIRRRHHLHREATAAGAPRPIHLGPEDVARLLGLAHAEHVDAVEVLEALLEPVHRRGLR